MDLRDLAFDLCFHCPANLEATKLFILRTILSLHNSLTTVYMPFVLINAEFYFTDILVTVPVLVSSAFTMTDFSE